MTRKFIAIALLASATLQASAAERSEAQIRQAASAALAKMPSAMAKVRSAQPMRVLAKNTQLTVMGYENGGFAIVANDDQFKPVFGYSDAQFAADTNPGFNWYMQALNNALEQAKLQGRRLEEVVPSAAYAAKVDELLKSRWGQDAPFNLKTPTYTDSKTGAEVHYVTGCVATAMAMVMHYYKYPVHGEGSIAYDYSGGGKSYHLEADFGDTTYEWDKMLNEYKEGEYTQEQGDAVATIMQHCGYSARMQYDLTGSGTLISDACDALRTYFGFYSYTKYYVRNYFNVNEWMDIVYRELNDKCPIIYGGQSTSGGHCFILDGYDSDGNVHVNWGWNGSSNGYFDIASLNGYNDGQEMVESRIATDTRYTNEYRSLWVMTSSLEVNECDYDGYNLVANVPDGRFLNMDVDNFTGYFRFMARNTATGEEYVIGTGRHMDDQPMRYYVSDADVFGSTKNLPNGEYRVYLATESDDWEKPDAKPQPIRCHENYHNSYIITVNNHEIEDLEPDTDSSWTMTGINTIQTTPSQSVATGVYSIDGRHLGNNIDRLSKGLYIVNGKKVVK